MKNKLESTICYKVLLKIKGKEFIITSLLDLGFYVAFYIGMILWVLALQIKSKIIGQVDLNSIAYQKTSELTSTLGTVQGFLFYLILFLVVFLIYALLDVTLIKGYIYTRITETKFTKKYAIKLFKANLIWYAFIVAILLFLLVLLKNLVIAPMILFIGISFLLYVTVIFQIVFAIDQKKIIKRVFFVAIQRIHKFILPLVLLIIIFSIITVISRGLQYVPQPIAQILSGAILLLFFAFGRFYLAAVVKKQLH
ncbi:MAG: hypothetical protein QF915_02355 [Candidatus Woesearchaeota archaeon]|nr:hypothetical protein [Candidatus Woesearchaeota archaeon]